MFSIQFNSDTLFVLAKGKFGYFCSWDFILLWIFKISAPKRIVHSFHNQFGSICKGPTFVFSQQEFNICEFLAVWVIVSENPLHLACVCSSPHPQSEKKKYIIWPLDKILLKQIFVGG